MSEAQSSFCFSSLAFYKVVGRDSLTKCSQVILIFQCAEFNYETENAENANFLYHQCKICNSVLSAADDLCIVCSREKLNSEKQGYR